MHLATMLSAIQRFDPQPVVVDPLGGFAALGDPNDVLGMLLRLVDALKVRQITGFFTSLSTVEARVENTDATISSLVDTWLTLLTREQEIGRKQKELDSKRAAMAAVVVPVP